MSVADTTMNDLAKMPKPVRRATNWYYRPMDEFGWQLVFGYRFTIERDDAPVVELMDVELCAGRNKDNDAWFVLLF